MRSMLPNLLSGLRFVSGGGNSEPRVLYTERYGERSLEVTRDPTGDYRARIFLNGEPESDFVTDSLIGAQMTGSRMLNGWKDRPPA